MHKLIVFDLDNTLCKSAEGMSDKTTEYLNKLREKGYILAIASGKPVYYLTGFARAAHIYDMIFIGENGTVITKGVKLPPKERYVYPYKKDLNKILRGMEERMREELPNLYFQPNEVMVTPFPKEKWEFDAIEKVIKEFDTDGLTIYRHPTCYDILPSVVNKGAAIKLLCEILQITLEDVITVGDAINDLEMFEVSDYSICIGDKVKEYTDISFATIEDALEHILQSI